jgi:hypothetical protein
MKDALLDEQHLGLKLRQPLFVFLLGIEGREVIVGQELGEGWMFHTGVDASTTRPRGQA